MIPEPTPGVKRRKSTKTMLAAKCKTCQRDTDPPQNRIVFCDSCSTAYHQYCHTPPISNEVVTVLEKEWLCGPCARSKESVVEGTEHLVAAANLSIDEVRSVMSRLRHRTDKVTETRVLFHTATVPARLSPATCRNTTSRTSCLSREHRRSSSGSVDHFLPSTTRTCSTTIRCSEYPACPDAEHNSIFL